jgi:CcmD family protein
MKFYYLKRFLFIILMQAVHLPAVLAQGGNRDFMRETGKIYVVVGVVILIFVGIVWYLLRLDRKLTKIEQQLNDD